MSRASRGFDGSTRGIFIGGAQSGGDGSCNADAVQAKNGTARNIIVVPGTRAELCVIGS